MAFLTYDEISSRRMQLNNGLRKLAKAADSNKPRVFISHSSADDEYIDGICDFINDFGASSYSDNGDDRLKEIPSIEAAELLRKEIRRCSRFVVLVSKNSARSGWVPWELGIADGDKGLAKVAILPISQRSSEEAWAGKEYLGLYPRIKRRMKDDRWIVVDPRDNKNWKLEEWLSWNIE